LPSKRARVLSLLMRRTSPSFATWIVVRAARDRERMMSAVER
jgi:hypothetical protein